MTDLLITSCAVESRAGMSEEREVLEEPGENIPEI